MSLRRGLRSYLFFFSIQDGRDKTTSGTMFKYGHCNIAHRKRYIYFVAFHVCIMQSEYLANTVIALGLTEATEYLLFWWSHVS